MIVFSRKKIGELGRVVTGKTPSTARGDFFDGEFPFITIPDLDGRVVIGSSFRTLSQKGAENVRSSLLPARSVMMSCIATVGKCGITDRPSLTNQQINSVIPNDDVDPFFLYYVFRDIGQELQLSGGGGSVYTNVSKSRFSDIEVDVPPLREQRAIAATLGALDDKIDLNRRMNETLEALARALFKDWFVDFGPTRAKMEGRAPYLDRDIWELFPDRLVENGHKKVPEGWSTGTFGDVAMQCGESVRPDTLDPTTPYIGLEHMPRRSIALSKWAGAGKVSSGKLSFRRGDFLFGKLRPYFHKVGIAPVDGICSTDIVVLNAREQHGASFVLACISQDEFVAFTKRTSDGTKMPRTSWGRMEQFRLCVPCEHTLQIFDELARPILNRIIDNVHESRTLAALRDLLLPRLMSGEIRVGDAGRTAKEVT